MFRLQFINHKMFLLKFVFFPVFHENLMRSPRSADNSTVFLTLWCCNTFYFRGLYGKQTCKHEEVCQLHHCVMNCSTLSIPLPNMHSYSKYKVSCSLYFISNNLNITTGIFVSRVALFFPPDTIYMKVHDVLCFWLSPSGNTNLYCDPVYMAIPILQNIA
jgi:hypothetical protein